MELSFRDNKDHPDELGVMKSWSWSKGSKSKEKKWSSTGTKWYESKTDGFNSSERQYDAKSGSLMTHSTKSQNWGGGIASYDYCYCLKKSSTFNFDVASSFSLSAAGSAELNISAAASAKVNIDLAADFELKTGAGIGLELDLRAGGCFKLAPSGKLQFDGIGFTARKKAALEAKQSTLEAEAQELRLKKIELDLEKPTIVINKSLTVIQKKSIHIESTVNIIL